MAMLASAKKMASTRIEGQFIPVQLHREVEGGVIFLSCEQLPELFVAVTSDDHTRKALESGLKNAFASDEKRVQVFTNGKVDGPTIDAVVCLTDVS